jgi:methyltransferase (TIGR00027 family)
MQPGTPSFTAFRAAAYRAAHQALDGGRVFVDPYAGRILRQAPADVFGADLDAPATRAMRRFIAARSRFAEDRLAQAVARGVRQYVVLGAGLDTFAHRNPFADLGLRVFEVDHPATQDWKRRRLAEAGLATPASLTFAPVNFERGTLAAGLADVGFDAAAPAFFAWLGVVVYLTLPAIMDTLGFIAALPPGAAVAFDYGEPVSAYPLAEQPRQAARAASVAALGEPWITRFRPSELADLLGRLGFDAVEDLRPAEIARRFFGETRAEGPGGHLVCAARLDGAA